MASPNASTMPASNAFLSPLAMNALKVGGITAALTLLGFTAVVTSVTADSVGNLPAVALGVGAAAGVSVYSIGFFNL